MRVNRPRSLRLPGALTDNVSMSAFPAAARAAVLLPIISVLAVTSVLAMAPGHAAAGQLVGPIPGAGSLGLVVWSGGPVEEIRSAISGSQCTPRSTWVSKRSGGLIGYLYGAPDVVNAPFRTEYAGGNLPSNTPLVLVCAPVASAPAPAPPAPTVGDFSAVEARMLALVNQERVANGLSAFTMDPGLSNVARSHSSDMVARGYFAHTSPDGLSPFDRMSRAGISFRSAAENIAWAGNVEVAHTSLMNSPGHRANILNPSLRRIGIGIVQKDGLHIMVTQLFMD